MSKNSLAGLTCPVRRVDDFTLMDGHLGTLFAKADWNPDKGQIDIDAVAKDTIGNNPLTVKPRLTVVKGYVSPKRNEARPGHSTAQDPR